jgi:hypothetical protein
MRRPLRLFFVVIWAIAAVGLPGPVLAQSAEEMNKSNNPLTPSPAFNLQNIYAPDIYGSDKYTNDFLMRGVLPLGPVGPVPVPQLIRGTVPISTRPDPSGGYTTGLGDINVFDIFLFKGPGVQLGAGPLLTIPTATADELGAGKWQAGLAGVVIDPSPARILGGLVQWQASFAGDGDRADVNTLTAQPFVIVNLPQGWYARSTGIWTWDLEEGRYYIPAGIGGGKVWRAGSTLLNLFVEPQWTVAHDGNGFPRFQVFAGLNMTFGK